MLLITGLGLIIVGVFFVLAMNSASTSMRQWAAQDAVNKLGKLADNIYGIGIGSQDMASIYMPDGVRAVSISGHAVQISIDTPSGNNVTVYADTIALLNGSLNAYPGWQRVHLIVNNTGAVQINESS